MNNNRFRFNSIRYAIHHSVCTSPHTHRIDFSFFSPYFIYSLFIFNACRLQNCMIQLVAFIFVFLLRLHHMRWHLSSDTLQSKQKLSEIFPFVVHLYPTYALHRMSIHPCTRYQCHKVLKVVYCSGEYLRRKKCTHRNMQLFLKVLKF